MAATWSPWILAVRNRLALAIIASPLLSASDDYSYTRHDLPDMNADLPPCSSKNAQVVSFENAEKLAQPKPKICVKISGYIDEYALHRVDRSKNAGSRSEPASWERIVLSISPSGDDPGGDISSATPAKRTVVGYLHTCDTVAPSPACEYHGARSMIDVTEIWMSKKEYKRLLKKSHVNEEFKK
jgi:hypothetical protein